MIVELTPAVILSLIGVLVVLGGLVWRLASKTEAAATREDLSREIATLRAVMDQRIADRNKESQVQHEQLAHKSALTRLDAELLDLKKEIREDLREMKNSNDLQLKLLNQRYEKMLVAVTELTTALKERRGEQHG